MDKPLSDHNRILAELYATKIVTMCLVNAFVETHGEAKHEAAKRLLTLAQNTAAVFEFSGGGSRAEQAAVREAMSERVEQIIVSAANPDLWGKGH